ncbi:MAG: hypothetical protein QNJ81_01960 [Acidimicrobiia bacterium]|nr:hypothetical protein [Acidimicrobiia bacterium]
MNPGKGRLILRRTLFAAVAAVFILISVGPVQAGESWLEPSQERVNAGDQVELTGLVSRGQLGWVDDGPFFVYLHGTEYGIVTVAADGGTATDVALGELIVDDRGGRVAVSASVVIPGETPAGEYQVVVCNDPCTTGLGDLVGGAIHVDPAEVPVRRLSLAPYPDRPTSMSPLWVGISAALATTVLVIALSVRQRS